MRSAVFVLVQIVLAWLVVGALMPPILLTVPAVRGPRAGTAVAGIVLLGVFLLLRLIWRRPRDHSPD